MRRTINISMPSTLLSMDMLMDKLVYYNKIAEGEIARDFEVYKKVEHRFKNIGSGVYVEYIFKVQNTIDRYTTNTTGGYITTPVITTLCS